VMLKDGGKPQSVGIIHCVGSRDKKTHEYCSRVCCMYSLKLAHLLKERTEAEVFNFYIDIRTPGKGFEEFYQKLLNEGVHFIRGRVAEVTDWALDAARPRDEELEAVRNLIRVCEAELDELGSTDRALVDHAIARMRRARGDLDEVMPFGQRQRVRQVAPVLFPAAIPVRAAPSTESCDVVG